MKTPITVPPEEETERSAGRSFAEPRSSAEPRSGVKQRSIVQKYMPSKRN